MLLTLVIKYLTTRSTRSNVAHLPKVVFVSKTHNSIFAYMLFPQIIRFIITLVDCYPNLLGRQSKIFTICYKLPRISNSFFFEIISKREVTKHLKKCMVSCSISYIVQVVVFTTSSNTSLATCRSRWVWYRCFTRKYVFKLYHSCIGKKQ